MFAQLSKVTSSGPTSTLGMTAVPKDPVSLPTNIPKMLVTPLLNSMAMIGKAVC